MKNNKRDTDDVVVIQSLKGWRSINFAEVWRHRELIYFLTWRDIQVRYKQTVLGILWAVVQPFFAMVVFSVVFGKLANVSSEGIPYPLFVYAGLLPWTYFSDSISRSAESLISNPQLIRKVYFPRMIIPISASLSALVDFVFSFLVLVLIMAYYKFIPGVWLILLPFLVLVTLFCSIGVGLWLSALSVLYRDIRHITPFFVRISLFLTPVIYSVSILPDKWAWAIYLNPMAGLIEGFRVSLLDYKTLSVFGLLMAVFLTIILFFSGAYFFRRVEKIFADVI